MSDKTDNRFYREAAVEAELPPLPTPLEIDWPELHSHALGCGVEDRNIRDRYEAAEYGWQDGVDKAAERVPEEIFTAEQMRDYARAALSDSQPKALTEHYRNVLGRLEMLLEAGQVENGIDHTRSKTYAEALRALLEASK
jgi:hypothetical protein